MGRLGWLGAGCLGAGWLAWLRLGEVSLRTGRGRLGCTESTAPAAGGGFMRAAPVVRSGLGFRGLGSTPPKTVTARHMKPDIKP